MAADNNGFEKSLARLEKIVSEMESGELSLDEMISRFEEGQKLLKSCTGILNEVEKKIEKLVKNNDGTLATEPFDAAAEQNADELF